MRVLLGLGDACLLQSVCRKELTECVGNLFFYKCNLLVRDRHVILCEAYIGCLHALAPVESSEVVVAECSRNLSCAVRAEVKEDNGISVLNGCRRSAVLHNDHRYNELVGYFFIIGSLDPFCRGSRLIALAENERPVSLLHTVPAIVTVHRIVAARHACDFADADLFHLRFQFFHIFFSGCRRCVTAVQEAVNVHFLNALSLRQLKQSINMRIVAVNAAVGNKSHQVQRGIIFLHILACRHKRFIFKEIPVLDGFRNLRQILVHDAACAHVQMSHLRISHLSVRKSYRHTAGISSHKRALSHQLIHDRRCRLSNCITVRVVS